MYNGISGLLVQRRLRWLDHVAQMEDNRFPKQLLFGELLTVRPHHGPKLPWKDVIVKDVQQMGLDALNRHRVAQHRPKWYELCQSTSSVEVPRGLSVVNGSFVYGCGRIFGHSGDLTRHKKYCNDQSLHQNNLSSLWVWQTFSQNWDLTRHQHYFSS